MTVYEDIYKALSPISRRKNKNQPAIRQKSHQATPWWQVYLLTAISLFVLFAIPSLKVSKNIGNYNYYILLRNSYALGISGMKQL